MVLSNVVLPLNSRSRLIYVSQPRANDFVMLKKFSFFLSRFYTYIPLTYCVLDCSVNRREKTPGDLKECFDIKDFLEDDFVSQWI